MSSQLGPVSTWMGDLIRRLTEGIDVSSFLFLFFSGFIEFIYSFTSQTFHLLVRDSHLPCEGFQNPCEGLPPPCGIPTSLWRIPPPCEGFRPSCEGLPPPCEGFPPPCEGFHLLVKDSYLLVKDSNPVADAGLFQGSDWYIAMMPFRPYFDIFSSPRGVASHPSHPPPGSTLAVPFGETEVCLLSHLAFLCALSMSCFQTKRYEQSNKKPQELERMTRQNNGSLNLSIFSYGSFRTKNVLFLTFCFYFL